MVEYEVVEGDSLFAIAEKFGVAPETVLLSNQDQLLDDPRSLVPGMALWIPPEDGAIHTWRSTDSWGRVADEYGVTIETIIEWQGNSLEGFRGDSSLPEVEPGSRIFIPGGTRTFFPPDDIVHLSTPGAIRQTGFGDSVVTLELNRFPAVLSLGTLGGTHMVLAHHGSDGLDSLDLLKTQGLVEGAAGISAIDAANGFARVSIQTSDEWGLELLELTDFQFVSAGWSAIGSGNRFLLLDDDFDGSLHLIWPGDGKVISIESLDGGPDSDLLVSTTMPYDDWLSVPKGARALYIWAAGEWTLELGERR
ncbi:MAG: LysM peptidoglycan-binding domain-containing protein [Anaerolineales bacterium]